MRDDVYVRDEKVEMILVWTKYVRKGHFVHGQILKRSNCGLLK
jgi:hypothetical protein